jgi:hypothetical protein
MDTLGSYNHPDVAELLPTIEAAARQALHDWGLSYEGLDDLVHDGVVFYLERPSVSLWLSKADTETARRRVFYRTKKVVLDDGTVEWQRRGILSQILSGNQTADNVFSGDEVYGSNSIKDWLKGTSTNKYLGHLIQQGLDQLEAQHATYREAIRSRYEAGVVPDQGSAAVTLTRSVEKLTENVNRLGQAEKQGEVLVPERRASTRRGGKGGHSDPTADVAMALMRNGDTEQEVHDGTATTYRQEFEMQTLPIGAGTAGGRAEWLDLFEGEVNDRSDLYRAAVFPDLYPDEPRMLIENWHSEDLAAYVGGEYAEGDRRV